MARNYNPNSDYERTKNLNSNYNRTAPSTNMGTSTNYTGMSDTHSDFYSDVHANELEDQKEEAQNFTDVSRNLVNDFTGLIRKEGELVRAELSEKIADVKTAATAIGAASIFTLVGTFMAAITATVALTYVVELWLSALIVTAVLLVCAAAFAYTAKKKVEPDNLRLDRSMRAADRVKTRIKERSDEYLLH